jgi:OPA family glycerol-3-phosphate transporter-like MFS transporter
LVDELIPIGILVTVITVVVMRLPRVDVGHTDAFRHRRALNWLPLGITYALLYFGRYNLVVLKDVQALTEGQYGYIFGAGAAVYGLSFFINGPLADRLGGRLTILIAAFGSAVCNIVLGLVVKRGDLGDDTALLATIYGANMYFQSFGAVSIVKVNSAWFHVRERGVFGGIFGILISLGIYFAFDWGHRIAEFSPDALEWVFWVPAITLLVFWMIDLPLVRDSPAHAGHRDFDPGDASSGDDGPREPAVRVFKRLLSNPIIITIALIEFCSGFLRNAIMHWYRDFAKGVGLKESFVYEHWGMILCIAGMTGGIFAGVISDRLFQSRRGPIAAVLYGIMLVGAIAIIPLLTWPMSVGWVVAFMSMAIIGVHGMLSGTASADFGGKKNAGIAVGIIDGAVYFGTFFQSVVLGNLLPAKGTAEASDIDNWQIWPIAMVPVALIGLALALKVWHARPQPRVKPTA